MKSIFKILPIFLAGCITQPLPHRELLSHHEGMVEQQIEMPAVGKRFTDPATGVSALRLTDARATGAAGFVSYYPKLNPFNADETLALVYERGGRWHLFSVPDGNYLKQLPIRNVVTDPQPRWHPLQPDSLFWFDGAYLKAMNVLTGETRIVREFREYTFITCYDEGNFGVKDGNVVTMLAGRDWPAGGGDWRKGFGEMFIYNVTMDSITSPRVEITGVLLDWLSISPRGNFAVIEMAEGHGSGQFEGVDVYDNSLKFINLSYYQYTDHADIGIDDAGREVYVTDNAEVTFPDRLRHIEAYDLASSQRTDLLGAHWGLSRLISARCLAKPGWAIISTYGNPGLNADTSLVPFRDEIFALRLNGSGEVRRIVQHRSQRFSAGDYTYNNYWDQPNAAVSVSGRFILFTSNWRKLREPEDVYLIDLDGYLNW